MIMVMPFEDRTPRAGGRKSCNCKQNFKSISQIAHSCGICLRSVCTFSFPTIDVEWYPPPSAWSASVSNFNSVLKSKQARGRQRTRKRNRVMTRKGNCEVNACANQGQEKQLCARVTCQSHKSSERRHYKH
jgi:hypothetical protein